LEALETTLTMSPAQNRNRCSRSVGRRQDRRLTHLPGSNTVLL